MEHNLQLMLLASASGIQHLVLWAVERTCHFTVKHEDNVMTAIC